jgi:hypothetical protein
LGGTALLTLWPERAAVKVRPDRTPPVAPPPSLALEAFRGEGIAAQAVLRSDVQIASVTPSLTPFTAVGGGTALPGSAAALYRVGFINIAMQSDPAGATGEWPDALFPIGADRFYGESRNGAPFPLLQDRSQPVWIDVRVPRTALPGDYQATFTVTDGAGAVIGSLPVRLSVFAAELPFKSFLPTSYGFGMYPVFGWFHNGATTPQTAVDLLTANFLAEAAAHRITLDVTDAYVAGTPPNLNWSVWDQYQSPPGISSHPVPVPPGLPAGVWNQQLLTPSQINQATAAWSATAQHYAQLSWLEGNYLYTRDEPQAAQYQINIQQAQVLRQADSRLHSLVTHEYDPALAPGNFDIWVPNVRFIDAAGVGALQQQYLTLQASGKNVWWYDSNNSGIPDASGLYGNWPDEFIDHPGVNQLVHGPLTFKYQLDGYLYYSTFVAFQDLTRDPYVNQFYFGRNGDGTLFYPGRADIIGGTQGIPLPSIRLQLLRQSWSLYDALELTRRRGFATQAAQIAGGLVSTVTSWAKDPAQYDQARSQLAALLAPQPRLLFVLDRSTFSDTEVAQTGTTAVGNAFYVILDGVLPAQIGMMALPGIQAERDAASPSITFQRASGALPGVRAVPTAVASEGPFDPYTVQRLTFTYTVEFTGIAAFLENGQPVDRQDVTVVATLPAPGASAAQATITLIRQPNPYMLDGIVPWLSGDLRVFQIGPNHALPFPTAAAAPSDAASARSFIQTVLTELDGNAANFEMLPAGYENSTLELARTQQGLPVFNFAIARVRYDGQAAAAQDVRVFFRLFTTAATGLDYHADLNYRRSAAAGAAVALLGETAAGELTTIPCIAVQRIEADQYGMDQQLVLRPDVPNTKTLPAGTGVTRFFGAWLDINQPSDPQFPPTPAGDGPWTTGRQPIQNLIRGRHQCLVAELYYVPATGTGDSIPVGATPGSSENLSQRNLSIVESANPTSADSRRVQTTFVVHQQADGGSSEEEGREPPDELMILWDALPAGAAAELTFSGINADAVLALAALRGGPDVLQLSADGALQCTVGGVTYIPLPSDDEPVPGLLSVTLPASILRGQQYEVLVRHVRGRTRRIVGSFALSIPVRPARELLAGEENTLAVLRHIQSQIEPTDRWAPVFSAYVQQVARRVDAFGGVAEAISASPDGAPVRRRRWCAWVLAALPALGWLAWRWLRRERRPRRHLRRLH